MSTKAFTDDEAYLLNLFFTCILYGAYFPMYFETMRILVPAPTSSMREGWSFGKTIALAATFLFSLETLSIILNLLRCINRFVDYSEAQARAVGIGIAVTYLTIPVGDGILLWRCFLVWGSSPEVIALPCLLWLSSVGAYIGLIVNETILDGGGKVTSKAIVIMGAFASLSTFILTASLTGLIAYRIWTANRFRRESNVPVSVGGSGVVTLSDTQRIVIETGLLWTLMATCVLAAVVSRTRASILATGIAKHVSGIAFSLMILRVSWRNPNSQRSTSSVETAPPRGTHVSSAVVFAPLAKPQDIESFELPKTNMSATAPNTDVVPDIITLAR